MSVTHPAADISLVAEPAQFDPAAWQRAIPGASQVVVDEVAWLATAVVHRVLSDGCGEDVIVEVMVVPGATPSVRCTVLAMHGLTGEVIGTATGPNPAELLASLPWMT